jgi:hypothetical protein
VYQITLGADSAHFQSVLTVTPSNPNGSISSTETGEFSWSATSGALTQESIYSGLYDIASQEIIDGTTTYTKLVRKTGPQASYFTSGSPGDGWTESTVTGSSEGGLLGLFTSGFMGAFAAGSISGDPNTLSPFTLFQVLGKDATSTTEIGSDTVGGIPTTHYRAIVPFGNLGASSAEVAEASVLLGTNALPVDYWVDSADRLVQLNMDVTIRHFPFGAGSSTLAPAPTTTTTQPSGGTVWGQSSSVRVVGSTTMKPPATVSVRLALSDYGVSVDASPPPPSEITAHQSCVVAANGDQCEGS